jgi:hypothetical protein
MAHRVLTFVIVGVGYMPSGREAPAVARPRGLPAEKVQNEIGAKMAAMDAIIAQCEARFGRRVHVLDHPILGPLTAPQWRKLHLVHGRHHQKQLLRLRESTTRQGSTRASAVFSSKQARRRRDRNLPRERQGRRMVGSVSVSTVLLWVESGPPVIGRTDNATSRSCPTHFRAPSA